MARTSCIPCPAAAHPAGGPRVGACPVTAASIGGSGGLAGRRPLAKKDTVGKVCEIVKQQLALPDNHEVCGESKFSELGVDSLDSLGSYPGTGKINEVGQGDGEGTTLNLPLRGGAGDYAMRCTFDEVIAPSAHRFKPDIILVSVGFSKE